MTPAERLRDVPEASSRKLRKWAVREARKMSQLGQATEVILAEARKLIKFVENPDGS